MRSVLVFVCLFLALPGSVASVAASSLFDDQSVLEVKLSGPLAAAVSDKRNRAELPFILGVDDHKYSIKVRVRGKSRVRTCAFSPLRLNFFSIDTINTVFAVQDKLKLVTHCEKTLVPKRMHWRNIRNFEFLT